MLVIMNGKRPPRPTHLDFTEGLWALMQRCWSQNPHLRPGVSEVSKALHDSSEPTDLQQFYHLNRSSPQFHDQLTNMLHSKEYKESVPNLQGNDLIILADHLDKVFYSTPLSCSLLKPA